MSVTKKLHLLLAPLLLSGCLTSPQPMRGIIYTDVAGPIHAVSASVPLKKRGEACVRSLFSVWTWGDASIATAKTNGEFTEIGVIDYEHLAVLTFIYTSTCTIVSGA